MALVLVFIVPVFLVSLALTFSKARWFIFYFGVVALFLQLLLYVKWSVTIYDSLSDLAAYVGVMFQINPGLLWSFVAAAFPFPLPLAAAYLVGSTTVDPEMGLKSFFFFSLAQTVILGFTLKNATKIEKTLKAVTGYAIPLFTFLLAVVNLFLPEGQQLNGFESVGNGLVLMSICCCLSLLYLAFLAWLFFQWKKEK